MNTLTTVGKKAERVRKPRTLEAFLEWDQPAGRYKYEWVEGELEKTDYMMKNTELGIVKRIKNAFYQTQAFTRGGDLFAETHVFVTKDRIRIPDLSFFDAKQIEASERGGRSVPAWAIEIISPNETGNKIERKALEYMNVGVKVLWQIYPDLRIVRVQTPGNSSRLYIEDDECSADPALPDLKISINELFG